MNSRGKACCLLFAGNNNKIEKGREAYKDSILKSVS